ncbi:MAG TPA: RHS repeat-associated core domain-containing protein, partial [Candidatus Dormibacteraeota bacterium]
YRNDGLLDTRAWAGTNASAAVTYDAAKRPTQLAITGSGVAGATVTQTYDRNGNVATDGRSFAGISGASGTGTATFTNDQLNRVTADAISGGNSYAYAYDPDGNRTSVTINAGTPTVSTYDATDQLLTEGPQGGTLTSFNYDPYGNMTTSAETFNSGTTIYTYDYGDRLTKVAPPVGLSGSNTYTLDALGRIGSETVGATTTTLSYVGTSKTVSRLASGTTNVDSLIGSDGSRLATAVIGTSFGWLLPDLHGDIAGASSSSLATITDALRYDAFGTIAASTTSALPTPWRYQGQLLVNPSGASDLYVDGARFYSPGLGAFTQLDSAQGMALSPLTLNRFLYAAADPETLIDPSGHTVILVDDAYGTTITTDSTHKHVVHHQTTAAKIKAYKALDWKKINAQRKIERAAQLAADKAIREARNAADARHSLLVDVNQSRNDAVPDLLGAEATSCPLPIGCGSSGGIPPPVLVAAGIAAGTGAAAACVLGGCELLGLGSLAGAIQALLGGAAGSSEAEDAAAAASDVAPAFRDDVSHIFTDNIGHFVEDTTVNRTTIMNAVKPENFVRTQGPNAQISLYFQDLPDGTQVWVQVRNGEITNAGLNLVPRSR